MSQPHNNALAHNLKRLGILRLINCGGISIALLFFGLSQVSQVQNIAAWGILFLMTLLSLLNIVRAKSHNTQPQEVFIYLLLDTLLMVALMYFSGGANNPFITYLLVPIVISAATLNWLSTWLLSVLAMSAYGLLLFFYQPLPALDLQLAQMGLSLHIVGMWFTFILSALFIAYFVVKMAQDLQYQASQTAYFREQSIQNEHVMLLASQAAITAHELGSPLTCIKMLSHELQHQASQLSLENQDDLKLINQQIDLCQEKLKSLTQNSELQQSTPQSLLTFIENTLQQWLLMRPKVEYQWQQDLAQSSPDIQYPLVLQQALINLLDNAANASDQSIKIKLSWDTNNWCLSIRDDGPGVDEGFSLPNAPMVSQDGLGIGLLLSHGSIQRLGGKVSLQNIEPQGCLTKIEVPLNVPK